MQFVRLFAKFCLYKILLTDHKRLCHTNSEQMGYNVEKGNKKLLIKINFALNELNKEGALSEISLKYFGKDISK
ncbi:transporter substrate-binding domain-containing protein [Campylobacter concisus]|uniref:transporter substrate-binding domain-containing protein n=1 Tax=Campylobacter concisus TaxID=199 RepID=UPI0021561D34|nr:transporter substrate-binding domain-containing protein [Campylobacter concisus]